MMKTYALKHPNQQLQLLFGYHEEAQENFSFSPFELMFRHQARGPVYIHKEALTTEH